MTNPDDVVGGETVEFVGQSFRVAPKLGLMPLLKFAHVAASGADSADMDGLAAMYDLLRAVIADDQWQQFEAHAITARADDSDLLAVVQAAIEVMTARPTKRPYVSSAGPSTTAMSSRAASPSPVSLIPAPTSVSSLDARAARELRPVEVAALDLIAN